MSIRRSIVLSLLQRQIGLLIQFGSTLVLSRLLTPHEVGVFSLCAVVVGFAHSLRDFGTGEYLVQERELTRARIRSAFTITLAAAWLLALSIWLAAPALARLYDEPELGRVLPLLALNFVFLPIGTPAFALLTREMQFGRILLVQTAAAATQAVVSIGFAWRGDGVMSLVWGSIAGSLLTVLLAAWFRPRDTWVLPGVAEIRRVGRFGLPACAAHLLGDASRSAHEFVLGATLGFRGLGLYNRAGGLVESFNGAVTSAVARVALPAFSRLGEDRTAAAGHYARGAGWFTLVAWPLFAFIALMAEPLIAVLFGDQWHEAVTPMRLLALGAIFLAPHAFAPQALVALGLVDQRLRLQLLCAPMQVGLIAMGSLAGLEAAAGAAMLAGLLVALAQHRAVAAALDLRFAVLASACAPSLRATLWACAGPVLLAAAGSVLIWPPLATLAAAGTSALAGWLVAARPLIAGRRIGAAR